MDRTAINDNFDATVKGAELEAMWEPVPGLKFNFAGGYEDTRIDNGQSSIDLMDRADVANHPDWMVVKPFVTQASNCILPIYVVAAILTGNAARCGRRMARAAFRARATMLISDGLDPVTLTALQGQSAVYPDRLQPWLGLDVHDPGAYPGFNPHQPGINNGEGFAKNLGGNQLPNAPHFTTSLSAANTRCRCRKIGRPRCTAISTGNRKASRACSTTGLTTRCAAIRTSNLALILTSAIGWQVMGYLKNVFDSPPSPATS